MKFANGEAYDGEWAVGSKTVGVLTKSNGKSYDVVYEDDKLVKRKRRRT